MNTVRASYARPMFMASGLAPSACQRAGLSQPQYCLGDDVLLDFVSAAVDRDLAHVEVGGRERGRPVGADRWLVPALLVEIFRLIGQRVGADHFEQQLADGLLDLRALDLEDRGGRVGPVALAVALGGDDAELRHLQRLELHLNRRDLGAEALVLDQRAFVGALERGEFAQAADALLRHADARDAGALVAEKELGVVPTFVLLADQILGRHVHVVEEHSRPPSMVTIGRTVMPGVFMSIRMKEIPSCFLAAGSVRTRQKIQSAYCAVVVQVFWPLMT